MSSVRLRVLVADDEALARDGLCALLAADDGIEVVASCADGEHAVRALREHRPDIAFLDVQMPGMDGFAVLRAVEGEHVPTVIFVTAYDRYALRAFDVHAVDHLLKPFDTDRFQLALARAKLRATLHESPEDEATAPLQELSERLARFLDDAESRTVRDAVATYPSRLVVRSDRRIYFVHTRDLLWIEAADYYVKLHTRGKAHMLRESMASLEQRLDPAVFFRIHRSAIVNLDQVREVQPYARGEYAIVLADDTRLKLSEGRRNALAERLGERL